MKNGTAHPIGCRKKPWPGSWMEQYTGEVYIQELASMLPVEATHQWDFSWQDVRTMAYHDKKLLNHMILHDVCSESILLIYHDLPIFVKIRSMCDNDRGSHRLAARCWRPSCRCIPCGSWTFAQPLDPRCHKTWASPTQMVWYVLVPRTLDTSDTLLDFFFLTARKFAVDHSDWTWRERPAVLQASQLALELTGPQGGRRCLISQVAQPEMRGHKLDIIGYFFFFLVDGGGVNQVWMAPLSCQMAILVAERFYPIEACRLLYSAWMLTILAVQKMRSFGMFWHAMAVGRSTSDDTPGESVLMCNEAKTSRAQILRCNLLKTGPFLLRMRLPSGNLT